MVGFFPGYKMPFHAARSIARRAWEGYGLEQVMTMDAGFLIFRFKQESDMQEVLAKGPWMFGGKHIALQQWHPRIQFEKNKIKSVPVWIRLYGLPFPLWTTEGLSRAASMVGKPLSCDAPTYNSTRLDYARVCVEVTADEDFIHQFELQTPLSTMPTTVRIEYEWKPTRCTTCYTYGHSCKKNTQDKSQDLDRPHLPPKHQESQLNPQTKPPKPNSTENQEMDQQQSNQPTSHIQETAQRKGKGLAMADTSNEIIKESIMESGHSRTLTANARDENEVTSSSRRDSSPHRPRNPFPFRRSKFARRGGRKRKGSGTSR
ncbi:DUF4283 domain-containing protein [Salix suchowensis]|nr:DUF4283 domain-containing protein [Salix suchowensis]